jgi:lysozyme family protein
VSDQFDALIGPLLAVEGGYTNNPADTGGETNFGVTLSVARENGYAGAMAAMTRDQASGIYRAKYWAKPGLYLISPVSTKVAAELFDTSVNMGTGTAGIFLQRALNALNSQSRDYPDVKVDGGIGPATAGALKALLAKRGPAGEGVILKALNCLQGARYIELAEGRAANETFEFGWLANRVSLAA